MYIAVEGLIGAGKTTFTTALAQKLKMHTILEDFAANPFLPGFYKRPDLYAFPSQIQFLLIHFRQLFEAELYRSASGRPNIIVDYAFEKGWLFASLNLSADQFLIFKDVYDYLYDQLVSPNLLVLLHAPSEVLLSRIHNRARTFEQHISGNYIEGLAALYDDFYQHYESSPILRIDTNVYDIVANPEVLDEIIDQVRDSL
jgi:deoxyguanosine kinase